MQKAEANTGRQERQQKRKSKPIQGDRSDSEDNTARNDADADADADGDADVNVDVDAEGTTTIIGAKAKTIQRGRKQEAEEDVEGKKGRKAMKVRPPI